MWNASYWDVALVAFLLLPLVLVYGAPFRWRVRLAAVLAPFQGYTFQVGGVYPPASLVFFWCLVPRSALGIRRCFRWDPYTGWLWVYVAWMALSLAWSPEPLLGLRYIVFFLPFLIVKNAVQAMAASLDESDIAKTLSLTVALTSVHAALIVVFRLYPELEEAFLKSSFAGFFLPPNALAGLFGDEPNNVLDIRKSGGLAINANVGGVLSGVAAMMALSLATLKGGAWRYLLALFLWVSVFFTGSKAASVLAVLFGGLSLWFRVFNTDSTRGRAGRQWGLLCVALGAGLATLLLLFGGDAETDFVSDTRWATELRLVIWGHAIGEFLREPFWGLGFGGWERSFEGSAAFDVMGGIFPPHNTFLQSWAQSGIVGVILLMVWMGRLGWGLLAGNEGQTARQRSFRFHLGLAFLWVFIQGQGENFGPVGTLQVQFLLGLGLGYALVFLQRKPWPT